MSTSSTKRRIGRFHIVVVQWTSVDLQSCCFAHKTNCFFCVVVVVVFVIVVVVVVVVVS